VFRYGRPTRRIPRICASPAKEETYQAPQSPPKRRFPRSCREKHGSPECVVADAGQREPVSITHFPDQRENTGNLVDLPCFTASWLRFRA